MTCGIHQNDIGTQIKVCIKDCDSVVIDISLASTKQILLKKPSGTTLTKTANFVTDGTDGLIYYSVESGDLSEVGTWKIQGIVTIGGNTWHSSFESFRVYRNIS